MYVLSGSLLFHFANHMPVLTDWLKWLKVVEVSCDEMGILST